MTPAEKTEFNNALHHAESYQPVYAMEAFDGTIRIPP